MKLPTVEIRNPAAPAHMLRINKSDFDPAAHQLWSDTHAQEQLQTKVIEASPPPSVGRSDREAELNALYYGPDGAAANWAPIKAAAAEHGIAKPEGGWEDAIALILEAEYPNA